MHEHISVISVINLEKTTSVPLVNIAGEEVALAFIWRG